MSYLGDFVEDAEVVFFFNTVDSTGAPVTIGGTAAVEVYKDGGLTQSSAGVTVTEDFDGVTGLHKVVIDQAADAFYATGSDYTAVVSVGTADSVSIVGGALASWSCENRTTTLGTVAANVVQISGDSTAADNVEAFFDGTGADPTFTNTPDVNVTEVGGSAVEATYSVVPSVHRNGSNDIWGLAWHVDGEPLTSGTFGAATMSVTRLSDGVNFLAQGPTTRVGSTNVWRRSTTTQISLSESYIVQASVTVDGTNIQRYATRPMSGAELLTENILDLQQTAENTSTDVGQVDSRVAAVQLVVNNLNDPSASAIADAVWDEAQADHTTADTFGAYLDAAVSGVSTGGVSAADIADAVWDEAKSGHATAGTFGEAVANAESDAAAASSTASTIDGKVDTIDANVDAIVTDTGTTLPGQINSLNDPTPAAIASQVRTELTTELGRIDAAITSREASGAAAAAVGGLNDPDAATTASAVRTELAMELARLDAAISSRASAGDAMTLTAGERDAVAGALLDLTDGVESSYTVRQALRITLAALAGKASGLDSNSPVYRDINDTTNRITATTDTNGNRTAVTVDAS